MIGITLDLKGAPELIGKSNRIRSLISRTVLNAMRRVVRRHVTTTKQDIRSSSGIGRTIWGKNASGLNPLVSLIRARMTPTVIETGIKLKGLPKMLEEGGRTKKHAKPMRSKSGGVLGPWTFGGRTVFAKVVNHPGSTVRAHHFAQTQLLRASPAIVREVDLALGSLVGNERGLQP